MLKIRMNGEWENGWIVESIGATKKECEVDAIWEQSSVLAIKRKKRG